MMKSAAIMASLVDVRNIAAHKCVRLEIHVPAEQCTEVLKAFGWPTMVNPVQVAVARIDPKAAGEAPKVGTGGKIITGLREAIEHTERRNWNDLLAITQAGIRCSQGEFWRFLETLQGSPVLSPSDAAASVRFRCGVASRSEFLPDTPAEKRWQLLEAGYQAWLTEEKYSGGRAMTFRKTLDVEFNAIWLSPVCDGWSDGRTWCDRPQDSCRECGRKWVRFVRDRRAGRRTPEVAGTVPGQQPADAAEAPERSEADG